MHAVCEAALNVACSGAMPAAITNCLNFGNPYDPEVYYTFAEAVAGMGEACRALDTPVTGGNVSFYNEQGGMAVYPSPVIGMVGVLDDVKKRITSFFINAGDQIAIIGHNHGELGGSEYLKTIHGWVAGPIPKLSLEDIKNTVSLLVELANRELINSAHDISDGGLAVTLAECCFKHDIGAKVEHKSNLRPDALLFGESRPLIVLSFAESRLGDIKALCHKHNVPIELIGATGGGELVINDLIKCSVVGMKNIYESAIPNKMEKISH